MSLTVKTAPAVEPISLAEAKAHLRVDISDDDAVIQNLIRAARLNLENTYNRAMITQGLVLGLDTFAQPEWRRPGWPGAGSWMWPGSWSAWPWAWSIIELRPPVQSISSISYTYTTGASQTLASSVYKLDKNSEPGRVFPDLAKNWPATSVLPGVVQIEFVAGYTTPELVPDDMKSAVKLYLGHLYEHREEVLSGTRLVAIQLPLGVDALMSSYAPPLVR